MAEKVQTIQEVQGQQIQQSSDELTDENHLFKKVSADILDIDAYGKYQEKFYTSSDVKMYVDGSFVAEMTSIQFSAMTEDGPAYSYNSKFFNTLIPGKFKVVGQFTINFTKSGYIYDLLLKSDELRGKKWDYENGELIDQADMADRDREKDKQFIVNEEFTKPAPHDDPSKMLHEQRRDFKTRYWGTGSLNRLNLDITQVKKRMFTISLLYGNMDDQMDPPRSTLHRISHVKITKIDQTIAPDGNPIQEVYTFIGRALDDPSEFLSDLRPLPEDIQFTAAEKKNILRIFLNEIGRALYTYLTDPDVVDIQVQPVFKKGYLDDIQLLRIVRSGWDAIDDAKIAEKSTENLTFWETIWKYTIGGLISVVGNALTAGIAKLADLSLSLFGNAVLHTMFTTTSAFYFRIKPRLAKGYQNGGYYGDELKDKDVSGRRSVIGMEQLIKLRRSRPNEADLRDEFRKEAYKVILDPTSLTDPNSTNMDPYAVFDSVNMANGASILGGFDISFDWDRDGEDLFIPQYVSAHGIDRWIEMGKLTNLMAAKRYNADLDQILEEKSQIDAVFGTIKITNEDASTEYNPEEDYLINYSTSTLKILSTGQLYDDIMGPEWNVGTTYDTGDFVRKGEKSYECLQDGVVGVDPSTDPQKWVERMGLTLIRIYFQPDKYLIGEYGDPANVGTSDRVGVNPDLFPDSFMPFSVISGRMTEDKIRAQRDKLFNLSLSNSKILAVDFDRDAITRRPEFSRIIKEATVEPDNDHVRVVVGKKGLSKGTYSNLVLATLYDNTYNITQERNVPSILKTFEDIPETIHLMSKKSFLTMAVKGNLIDESYTSGNSLLLSVTDDKENVFYWSSNRWKAITEDWGTEVSLRDSIKKGDIHLFPMVTPRQTKAVEDDQWLLEFYKYKSEIENFDTWHVNKAYVKDAIIFNYYKFYKVLNDFKPTSPDITAYSANLQLLTDSDIYESVPEHVLTKADISSVQMQSTITTESGSLRYNMMIQSEIMPDLQGEGIKLIRVRALPESLFGLMLYQKPMNELNYYNDFEKDFNKKVEADGSIYFFIANQSFEKSNIIEGVVLKSIVPRIVVYLTSTGFFFDYLSYINELANRLVPIYGTGSNAIDISPGEIRDAISDGFSYQREQYGVSSSRNIYRNILADKDGVLISRTFMTPPLSNNILEQLNSHHDKTDPNENSPEPTEVLNTENYLTVLRADSELEPYLIGNLVYRYHHQLIEAPDDESDYEFHAAKTIYDAMDASKKEEKIIIDEIMNIQHSIHSGPVDRYIGYIASGPKLGTVAGFDDISQFGTTPDMANRADLLWKEGSNVTKTVLPHSEFHFISQQHKRLTDIAAYMRRNPNPEETTQFIELMEKDPALSVYGAKGKSDLDYYTYANYIDFTFDYFHTTKSAGEIYGA